MDNVEASRIDRLIHQHNSEVAQGRFSLHGIPVSKIRAHSAFKEAEAAKKVLEFLNKRGIQ